MSTLDARIMQFMSRKETQYPELKQPSVVMYRSLRTESHGNYVDHNPKTFKKSVGSPLARVLFTA